MKKFILAFGVALASSTLFSVAHADSCVGTKGRTAIVTTIKLNVSDENNVVTRLKEAEAKLKTTTDPLERTELKDQIQGLKTALKTVRLVGKTERGNLSAYDGLTKVCEERFGNAAASNRVDHPVRIPASDKDGAKGADSVADSAHK